MFVFHFKVNDYVIHESHGKGRIVAIDPQSLQSQPYLVLFESGLQAYCSYRKMELDESPRRKIALVRFLKGPNLQKKYHFKTDLSLDAGDLVVVDTIHGFQIARVVDTIEESEMACRWVVERLNLARHEERLAQEAKVKVLKAELSKRRQIVEDHTMHAIMSKIDPEYAKAYSQLVAMGEI